VRGAAFGPFTFPITVTNGPVRKGIRRAKRLRLERPHRAIYVVGLGAPVNVKGGTV